MEGEWVLNGKSANYPYITRLICLAQSKIKGNYLYKVECIQDNKLHHAMSNLRSGYTSFWTLVIDGSPKKSSHIVNIEVNYRFIDSKNILSLITWQLVIINLEDGSFELLAETIN